MSSQVDAARRIFRCLGVVRRQSGTSSKVRFRVSSHPAWPVGLLAALAVGGCGTSAHTPRLSAGERATLLAQVGAATRAASHHDAAAVGSALRTFDARVATLRSDGALSDSLAAALLSQAAAARQEADATLAAGSGTTTTATTATTAQAETEAVATTTPATQTTVETVTATASTPAATVSTPTPAAATPTPATAAPSPSAPATPAGPSSTPPSTPAQGALPPGHAKPGHATRGSGAHGHHGNGNHNGTPLL